MRITIDIDDQVMADAMKSGPFRTRKAVVEAGLRLLVRKAAYREILKWRGRLRWEGADEVDWTALSANRRETAVPVQKARRARP